MGSREEVLIRNYIWILNKKSSTSNSHNYLIVQVVAGNAHGFQYLVHFRRPYSCTPSPRPIPCWWCHERGPRLGSVSAGCSDGQVKLDSTRTYCYMFTGFVRVCKSKCLIQAWKIWNMALKFPWILTFRPKGNGPFQYCHEIFTFSSKESFLFFLFQRYYCDHKIIVLYNW